MGSERASHRASLLRMGFLLASCKIHFVCVILQMSHMHDMTLIYDDDGGKPIFLEGFGISALGAVGSTVLCLRSADRFSFFSFLSFDATDPIFFPFDRVRCLWTESASSSPLASRCGHDRKR